MAEDFLPSTKPQSSHSIWGELLFFTSDTMMRFDSASLPSSALVQFTTQDLDMPQMAVSDTSSTSHDVEEDYEQEEEEEEEELDEEQPKQRRRRRCRRRRRRRRRGKGSAAPQPQEPPVPEEVKMRYIAMDCEMVGVGYNGLKSALARVCLVNWYGEIVLDIFVQPEDEVHDYRTMVSGIVPQQLHGAVSPDECRALVAQEIHGKILVGHGLKSDLRALGMTHPWYDVRDTAKYEPFMKVRFDDGILWPRKLKELAKEKLRMDIQLPGFAKRMPLRPWSCTSLSVANGKEQ